MFTLSKRCVLPVVASSLFFFAAGCGGAPETLAERVEEVSDWIDNPGDIRDTLAAVGSAKILGNVSSARNRAEADARAKMAATARAQVQSLMSNWFKETGDNLDERTVASYMNDEGLIRQLTDTEIIGARPVRYKDRGGVQYVLMVIDDAAKWTQQVGTSVKDKILKDQTLFKTEVMKRDFEEKLDKLINRDAQAAGQAAEQLEQKFKPFVK
jgi:hypothetical protein